MELLEDTIALHLSALFDASQTGDIISNEADLDSIFKEFPVNATQICSRIMTEHISDENFTTFVASLLRKVFLLLTDVRPSEKSTLKNNEALQMIHELAEQILKPKLNSAAFKLLWQGVQVLIESLHQSMHPSFALDFSKRVKNALEYLVTEAKEMMSTNLVLTKTDPMLFQTGLRLMVILGRMIVLASNQKLFQHEEEPLEQVMNQSFEFIIFIGRELVDEYQEMMPIYSKTSKIKPYSQHVGEILNFTLDWVCGILTLLQSLENLQTVFKGVRHHFINIPSLVNILYILLSFDNEVETKKKQGNSGQAKFQRHLITDKYSQTVNELLNQIRKKTLQITSILLLIDEEIEILEQDEEEPSELHSLLPQIEKSLIQGLFTYFMSSDIEDKKEREQLIESRLLLLNRDQSPIVYEIVLLSVMIIRTKIELIPPETLDSFEFYKKLAVGVLLPLFVTTPKERETMAHDPSQYILLCQDIVSTQKSMDLKSQAAKLLENFVDNCYEMKYFILSFTHQLFRASLLESTTNVESFDFLKSYKDYPIIQILPFKIQLDISLMVLAILSYIVQDMHSLLPQLDSAVSSYIDKLVNHPFLVIKVKFLLFLQHMYDLLFEDSQQAQNKTIKFILNCYTGQTKCENNNESDLLQIMAIECFHQIITCQQKAVPSLESHMLDIFQSILYNIEHCQLIQFFQHIDHHLLSHGSQMLETTLSEITDTEAKTPLLLQIMHSFAVRLSADMEGECFERVHQSFKFFFSNKRFAQLWKKQRLIEQIEPWGLKVLQISFYKVSEDIILTLALALARCNEGTKKFNLESLEFLRYFLKYLDYHLKKGDPLKEGLLKPQGMAFIQSLCRSEDFTNKIDEEFEEQGGFVSLIIGKLGFDLMSLEGVRTFEEGITVLLEVLMVGNFSYIQTTAEKMNQDFLAKMLEFFALGRDTEECAKSYHCQQLVCYCYMGCALAHPSLCMKFLSAYPKRLKEITETALSKKKTMHQHGLCAIGISILLKQKDVIDNFEYKQVVRLLAAAIKSLEEMKRISETDEAKQEDEENEEEKQNEEQKENNIQEMLNQADQQTPIIGYFSVREILLQNSQIYDEIFSGEEALECLKTAVESLLSSPKVGFGKLMEELGKSKMKELDELMRSVTVHKQVRRVFKATRKMIVEKPNMRLIEEMANMN